MTYADETLEAQPASSLVTIVHVVYALHAVSLGIGALTTATVVGAFLLGWPSIIAVVINYVKRGDARGTWLESHFNWQIRTFWLAIAWCALIGLISFPLLLAFGLGIVTWFVGLFVLGIWAIYRVAYGWLRLKDGKPIPGS